MWREIAGGIVPGMDVSSLHLPLPDGAGVPEWIHLLPSGTFSDTSGRKFRVRDAAKVIEQTRQLGKLPLDENHSTQKATLAGAPSPARAWISEFEVRADGIWGKPDWNASGTALMTDKAYKNISPGYRYDKDGNVLCLVSAALTNDPGLPQLTALHSHNGTDMDKVAICTALGLPKETDDAAVLTALQTASGNATALQTANAKVAALEAENQTLKATMVKPESLVALQTDLETMKAEQRKREAVAFVDTAIQQGKPIKAAREQYIALHTANPKDTEEMINKLPSINAGGTVGRRAGAEVALQTMGGDDLSAEELAMCTKMGNDPKKYAEFKKTQAEKQGSAV